MKDSIQTPIGEMWLDDDGLLWHQIHATKVTADVADEVKRAVNETTGGRMVPAIVDIRAVAYAEFDARDAFAGSAEESLELATALIVRPGASDAMAKAFTTGRRPARPVRIFTSETEAVDGAKPYLPAEA